MSGLEVVSAGPWASLQDGGRAGWIAQGLSPAGAVDSQARAEAAVLLGADPGVGIETAGPIQLKALTPLTLALSGAETRAQIEDRVLAPWSAFRLETGEVLRLSAPSGGQFALISVAGGIDAAQHFGSASVDYAAGIGRALEAGDVLACPGPPDPAREDKAIDPLPRSLDRPLRLLPGLHHALLADALEDIVTNGAWQVARSGRTGVALEGPELPMPENFRNVVSDFTLPGDVQILGDGTPFVLGPEGQSMGGYPRPFRVIAADRVRLAQARPGTPLRFEMVDREVARAAYAEVEALIDGLAARPIRRAVTTEALLKAQLIDGVVAPKHTPDEDNQPC